MCLLRDMHAHAAALTETNPGVLISDAALPIDAQLPYTYRSADDCGGGGCAKRGGGW